MIDRKRSGAVSPQTGVGVSLRIGESKVLEEGRWSEGTVRVEKEGGGGGGKRDVDGFWTVLVQAKEIYLGKRIRCGLGMKFTLGESLAWKRLFIARGTIH